MSPNITTDVLRAQCAELRQQMQALAQERDRWREQAKAMLAMLPDRLENTYRNGMREAYSRILHWQQCYGTDTVASRTSQELAALVDRPELAAAKQACDWCLGRGYIFRDDRKVVCPACRCGLPAEEGE
jgi:seryl-tRNA synthetase